jgi:hypothetical protein
MLPRVLYGCENWYPTLKEEHRRRVSENRVLSRVFGSQGEEVVGGWKGQCDEELHSLHASPNIIRVII